MGASGITGVSRNEKQLRALANSLLRARSRHGCLLHDGAADVTRAELNEYLRLIPVWAMIGEEARVAFENEMRNRHYGREETIDAFLWFGHGWIAMKDALINFLDSKK